MQSIDHSFSLFHNYSFTKCLAEYKDQLLLKGITYYERYLVFEHIKRFIKAEILDFDVKSIELIFCEEQLVGIHFFIEEVNVQKVIGKIEAHLDINVTKYQYSDYDKVSDCMRINGYWLDSEYIVAIIGTIEPCIYIGLKEFNMTIIDVMK